MCTKKMSPLLTRSSLFNISQEPMAGIINAGHI